MPRVAMTAEQTPQKNFSFNTPLLYANSSLSEFLNRTFYNYEIDVIADHQFVGNCGVLWLAFCCHVWLLKVSRPIATVELSINNALSMAVD